MASQITNSFVRPRVSKDPQRLGSFKALWAEVLQRFTPGRSLCLMISTLDPVAMHAASNSDVDEIYNADLGAGSLFFADNAAHRVGTLGRVVMRTPRWKKTLVSDALLTPQTLRNWFVQGLVAFAPHEKAYAYIAARYDGVAYILQDEPPRSTISDYEMVMDYYAVVRDIIPTDAPQKIPRWAPPLPPLPQQPQLPQQLVQLPKMAADTDSPPKFSLSGGPVTIVLAIALAALAIVAYALIAKK